MDRRPSPSSEAGFSLVEILISLVIFMIAALGVSYCLIRSNQQMITAEHILNSQQYGMASSVVGANAPTNSFQLAGTQAAQTPVSLPVTLTLSAAQPTQACSPGLVNGFMQALGNVFEQITCLFGSFFGSACQNNAPPATTPTSLTVSVPATAFTTSASQIAWWNP
ncbi:MAG: prepilin-type N-terminal cleavage/methylation domain-containing protein [Synergistaceae bacterium]